jgi:hypothetical protein
MSKWDWLPEVAAEIRAEQAREDAHMAVLAERAEAEARARQERDADREQGRIARAARRQQREAGRAESGWVVLGIDPGAQGAVALLRCWPGRDRPQLEALGEASDARRVRQLVPEADLIVVEGQSASPQMGVVGAFSLGMAAGRLQEAVEAGLRGRAVTAYPARWRASYGLRGGSVGKADGMALVVRLLETDVAVHRHDEADAVLLAWWGWRHVLLAEIGSAPQAAVS